MNLKNYTSEVPASSSLTKIEKYLVQSGATDINKKYSEGICVSINFRMQVGDIPLFIRLPAKVNACFKVMWEQIVQPKKGTEQRIREQAERTAWKIISDWVEIQFSMIQLEQAEAIEVFLPYVYNPATDQTFFQQIKEKNYKGLLSNG